MAPPPKEKTDVIKAIGSTIPKFTIFMGGVNHQPIWLFYYCFTYIIPVQCGSPSDVCCFINPINYSHIAPDG